MINSNDVIKIAGLAKLKIKEDQISSFTDQMNQILNFINQLNNHDTSQVEATAHALSSSAPLREDEVQPFTL